MYYGFCDVLTCWDCYVLTCYILLCFCMFLSVMYYGFCYVLTCWVLFCIVMLDMYMTHTCTPPNDVTPMYKNTPYSTGIGTY